jgi:phosphotransferase system HPr (HPr) family protein
VIVKEVEIVNRLGLHARASAKFVTCAGGFKSLVQVERDGRKVNGKSIMGVMMLAAAQGGPPHPACRRGGRGRGLRRPGGPDRRSLRGG